jgi:hypothetical protein
MKRSEMRREEIGMLDPTGLNGGLWQMHKEKYAEWVRLNGNRRLYKTVPRKAHGFDRFLAAIGDLLVAAGLRLKARYEPLFAESTNAISIQEAAPRKRVTEGGWSQILL